MKPTLKRFEKAVEKYGGNLTKIAESFKVSRSCIYKWVNTDSKFKELVDDARMRMFDECLSAARILVNGIPHIEMVRLWDG